MLIAELLNKPHQWRSREVINGNECFVIDAGKLKPATVLQYMADGFAHHFGTIQAVIRLVIKRHIEWDALRPKCFGLLPNL